MQLLSKNGAMQRIAVINLVELLLLHESSVGIFSCCCPNSFCLPLSFHMSLFKSCPHIHLPNEECDQFSLAETIDTH